MKKKDNQGLSRNSGSDLRSRTEHCCLWHNVKK